MIATFDIGTECGNILLNAVFCLENLTVRLSFNDVSSVE